MTQYSVRSVPIVSPALVPLEGEYVEQELQRVLALERLLHVDLAQVVNAPEILPMLIRIGSGFARLISVGSGSETLISVGSGSETLISVGSGSTRQIKIGSGFATLFSVGFGSTTPFSVGCGT